MCIQDEDDENLMCKHCDYKIRFQVYILIKLSLTLYFNHPVKLLVSGCIWIWSTLKI